MKHTKIVTELAVSALLSSASVITPITDKTVDNANNVQIEQVVKADFDRQNCTGTVTLVPVVGNSPASNPISKAYGASWHFKFVNGKCVSQNSYVFHAWHIQGYHLVDPSQATMTITSDMVNSYGLTQAVVEYAPDKPIHEHKVNTNSGIIGNYETREGMHLTKGRGTSGKATYSNTSSIRNGSNDSRAKVKKLNKHKKGHKSAYIDVDDTGVSSSKDEKNNNKSKDNSKIFLGMVATGLAVGIGLIASGIVMLKKHF